MARTQKKISNVTLYDVARVFGIDKEQIYSLGSITKACGYKKKATHYIETMVTTLEEYGIVEYKKGYVLSSEAQIYTGTFLMTRGGASFCVVEGEEDIFIPCEGRYGASSHDIVEVLVIVPKTPHRKAEGCVLCIRSSAEQAIPARAIQKISLTSFLFESISLGSRLRFLVTFENEQSIPYTLFRRIYTVTKGAMLEESLWEGHLVECLGKEEDVSTQEKIVQIEHNLRRVFPDDVLAEVNAIPTSIDDTYYEKRKNLVDYPFVTIDGEDSRDFDDAIYVEERKESYVVYVAIADVVEYVHTGTALDKEACTRSNSYYFPTMVLPMLPEQLSNGICSLQPHVDRLAMVVEIEVNKKGKVLRKDVYEGIIRSHARLTYTKVQMYFDRLDGKEDSDIDKGILKKKKVQEHESNEIDTITDDIGAMLQHARSVANILYTRRCERGALFFTSTTPYFVIENDSVVNVVVYPQYYAHMLIEECMLIANECIADILAEHDYPVVYRVHSPPTEEKLEALRAYAMYCFPHHKLPTIDSPDFVQTLLDYVEGSSQESIFHTIAIRSMMQARYSLENEGHYGLQSERYCHFTSPIRRYADCLVHRSVKAYLHNQKSTADTEEYITQALTLMNTNERVAMNAEREAQKRLGALYMKQYVGSTQDAVISGISYHALHLDFPLYSLSGIILLSSLLDDYYDVREEAQHIVGRRTGTIYGLGDMLRVVITNVSLETFEIQCSIAQKKQRNQRTQYERKVKVKRRVRSKTSHKEKARKRGNISRRRRTKR
ncbi:MAG: VacB/RNase II family 3'-5' exoribonuclease [Desulfovibrionaceae bacterium]|nr:VacB/RNase II family 3'-5' exoribonuclease [Desulfovibrionaceae bacterium]